MGCGWVRVSLCGDCTVVTDKFVDRICQNVHGFYLYSLCSSHLRHCHVNTVNLHFTPFTLLFCFGVGIGVGVGVLLWCWCWYCRGRWFPSPSLQGVLTRVVLDQALFAPAFCGVFFASIFALEVGRYWLAGLVW